MNIPFFIDVKFDLFDDPNPLTPVDGVRVGIFDGQGCVTMKFGFDGTDDEMFKKSAEWLSGLAARADIFPVGWQLRNLVWPAFVNNCWRTGSRLPKYLLMPSERKWNNLDMVDLQGLFCQGGYTDWRPTLEDGCNFLGVDYSEEDPIQSIFGIYKKYQYLA